MPPRAAARDLGARLDQTVRLMPATQTFTATFHEDAQVITIAGRRRMPARLFAILWACGWSLTVAVSALDLVRHPDMDLERNALWLGFWLIAGGAIGFVLLWQASGQREIVSVNGRTVRIAWHAGPFWRTRAIDVSSIRHLGYRKLPRHRSFAPIAAFWRGDLGHVVIETPRRVLTFGAALSEPDAAQVIELLRARLAHVPLAAGHHVPHVMPSRHYLASAGAAVIAGMVVWPALTVPLQLALVDRAICFAGDPIPPVNPADVRGIRPGKRVQLVGLDDVRTERLEQVAQELRTTHRAPISVATARVASAAYDAHRRQLNAASILDALERTYPARESVVIAVTDRDMYIPAYGWRYAFSFRSRGRLAIVSTARMERGCLGLFAANEQRQRARLRKMIGKNLGVLYFGLPLSQDPRSLMYAHVGGPQELDVMSEVF